MSSSPILSLSFTFLKGLSLRVFFLKRFIIKFFFFFALYVFETLSILPFMLDMIRIIKLEHH